MQHINHTFKSIAFHFRTTSLSTHAPPRLRTASSSLEGGLESLEDLNLDLSLGLLDGISVSSGNALSLGETGADGLLREGRLARRGEMKRVEAHLGGEVLEGDCLR